MKVFSPDGAEMMQVLAFEHDQGRLVFKGRAFGAMPMTGRVTPAELRNALRLLGARGVLRVLLMLLRR